MNILELSRYKMDEDCHWYTEDIKTVFIPTSNVMGWNAHEEEGLTGSTIIVGCIGSSAIVHIFVEDKPRDIARMMKALADASAIKRESDAYQEGYESGLSDAQDCMDADQG